MLAYSFMCREVNSLKELIKGKMNTRILSKFLGVGLAIGLVFSLGAAFVQPDEAQADEMEWGTVNTPSWDDLVIEPGSDIFDYVAAGEDGSTVYALGAVYGAHSDSTPCGDNDMGTRLNGDFTIEDGGSGSITITAISDNVGEVEGSLTGNTCYLEGDFTWINGVFIATVDDDFVGEMAVSGEIVDDGDTGTGADTMDFSGYIYRDTGGGANDTINDIANTYDFAVDDSVCVTGNRVVDFQVGATDLFFRGDDGVEDGDNYNTMFQEPRVWKSTDAGVSWTDITGTIQDASNLPGPYVQFFYGGVDTSPNNEDWLAIGGGAYVPPCDYNYTGGGGPGTWHWFGSYPDYNGAPCVVASQDGAGGFTYTRDMRDNGVGS